MFSSAGTQSMICRAMATTSAASRLTGGMPGPTTLPIIRTDFGPLLLPPLRTQLVEMRRGFSGGGPCRCVLCGPWCFDPHAATADQWKGWRTADRYSFAEMAELADQDAFHERRQQFHIETLLRSVSRLFRHDNRFSAADLAQAMNLIGSAGKLGGSRYSRGAAAAGIVRRSRRRGLQLRPHHAHARLGAGGRCSENGAI